jgi:threonine dehydrogenase-like Zn-dependent dehydrogenase
VGDRIGCVEYDYLGSRRDGAFAEYLYAPEENIFLLPGHADTLHAAMTEPCSVALHGVRKFNKLSGKIAIVFGGGPIGNMAAQWLRLLGCNRVIIIEIDKIKLKIAEKMGFETINPENFDLIKTIYEITNNRGADKVVEACGLPLTYRQSIQAAGRQGEVVLLGTLTSNFIAEPKDISHLLRKEIKLHGSWNSSIVPIGKDDWSTVLQHIDKELNVTPLISHTPDLKDGVHIFNKIINNEDVFNKVIFKI